jgi:glutamate carboxypeptidase
MEDFLPLLQRLVEIETPSRDEAAITRFADLLETKVRGLAKVKRVKAPGYGPHLLLDFQLGPKKKDGKIVGLAHSDTVHPAGTLARFPFAVRNGRVFGPGALDIKGGIAQFLVAMRQLQAEDFPLRRKVILQINSDEEIGSPSSRRLTEEMAKDALAVLVVEPGQGPKGHLKTARKGTGDYTVRVQGRAAHAGVDFAAGASAIVELARQVEVIQGFTDLSKGLTVNPGIISGGTRTNVVAEHAEARVDIRIERLKDFGPLDKKFRRLKPFDKRCHLSVEGGLNRPPMERTKAVAALFTATQFIAKDLGLELGESSTGGGSDGNFTAALGVPTLDGLGMVGEGAHTLHENFVLARVPERIALLRELIRAL